ncbi:MAG: 30S ribosomal protein S3 [Aggregatilineales bacterium]|nr:30S ribosomal protein S3 [Chloroflexota bacterium]HOA23721.1 30S ribosomal protein S3 [Aggregatilineales bacterium]HQE17853.1 30S ribosomal protein S3 [Aggregatilineales bacterium]
MGRKVHPTGMRLKIIKDWNARWYAEGRRYGELLHEDFAIRKLIESEHDNAGISNIEIERYPNQVQVTLHTARPGIVIGRKGTAVKELRQKLEELTGKNVRIEVEEVEQPDLEAKLVAENVAGQLERRISHSRAMKRAASQAMRQGAQGIRIMVSGRLGGSEMSRTEWVREGRVPLQTLRADIDYGTAEADTTFGKIGVKVWVYKGEVLGDEQQESEGVYVS